MHNYLVGAIYFHYLLQIDPFLLSKALWDELCYTQKVKKVCKFLFRLLTVMNITVNVYDVIQALLDYIAWNDKICQLFVENDKM